MVFERRCMMETDGLYLLPMRYFHIEAGLIVFVFLYYRAKSPYLWRKTFFSQQMPGALMQS